MENQPIIPTTVVGSHPKPSWWHNCKDLYAEGKWGETDLNELLTDAVDIAILDQTRAGLDIITDGESRSCLLYTSPSPRDKRQSRMPSSA